MIPQVYDGITLLLLLNGTLEVSVSGEKTRMEADDILLINSMEPFDVSGNEDNTLMSLSISREGLEQYTGTIWTYRFFCNSKHMKDETEKYNRLHEILAQLMVINFRQNPYYEIEINQYFYTLLSHLIKSFQCESITLEDEVVISDERIKRITQKIQTEYSHSLSLEDFAKAEFMSYHHLSRAFKKNLGITFTEYVNRIRMAHAVEELKLTSHSIVKIAFNNGFANAKIFHKVFKKYLGVSPAAYRQENSSKTVSFKLDQIIGESDYETLQGTAALQELSRYLVEKDISHEEVTVNKNLRLSIKKEQKKPYCRNKKIINLGQAYFGLEKESQKGIALLQKELQFQIIRFQGFCIGEDIHREGIYSYDSEYLSANQWFDFVQRMQLTPMIHLKLPETIKDIDAARKWSEKQIQNVKHLLNRYGMNKLQNWYFEWQLENKNAIEDRTRFNEQVYQYLYEQIKCIIPLVKIGVTTLTKNLEQESDYVYHYLKRQYSDRYIPDFYTFQAVPDKDTFIKNPKKISGIGSYQRILFYKLKEMLQSLKKDYPISSTPEIFLTDWNTLSGDNGILAGTFFRAALIAEALLELTEELSGIGFWINLNAQERIAQKTTEGALSLYLYGNLKRPVFFVIQFLNKMGTEIIEAGDGYLLTRKEDEIQLLLYNANYLDPLYSVDNYWLKHQSKEVTVCLQDINNGLYKVRHYKLDKDNGGLYYEWVRVGGETDIDDEATEYLEGKVLPRLLIDRKKVSEGQITMTSTLTLNGCELYIFQPLY